MTSRPDVSANIALLPGVFALVAIAELFTPFSSHASTLLAGAAGSADSATAGSTMAEALSPLGAQFSNPAGLAGFEQPMIGGGLGLAYGRGEVTADVPAGYHADNEVLVPFFDMFLAVPYGRWTFGISSMGTSGARFDYGPRPEVGVDDGFFSESGMFGVPIAAAYRVNQKLWLGAQIAPIYGSVHLRFSREVAEMPGVATPFRFTTSGFGVQSMFGMTWKPNEAWSLGLSVKPPGRVWTDGDTPYGNGKQDVDLEIKVPAEVGAGLTRALAERWKVSYALRFTDTSVLAKSRLRFEQTPSANSPYLHSARDEWRHAIGLEYGWSEALKLLGGVSRANGIVGGKGVNPSSYDSSDWRLHCGIRWAGDVWTIDSAFAYIFSNSRHVDADEALVFPGKYESKPAYLLSITVTKVV